MVLFLFEFYSATYSLHFSWTFGVTCLQCLDTVGWVAGRASVL